MAKILPEVASVTRWTSPCAPWPSMAPTAYCLILDPRRRSGLGCCCNRSVVEEAWRGVGRMGRGEVVVVGGGEEGSEVGVLEEQPMAGRQGGREDEGRKFEFLFVLVTGCSRRSPVHHPI